MLRYGQAYDLEAACEVAVVVERDGRFLLVEEDSDGEIVLNQPAGHLAEGEDLLAAVARETLEETRNPGSGLALAYVNARPEPNMCATCVQHVCNMCATCVCGFNGTAQFPAMTPGAEAKALNAISLLEPWRDRVPECRELPPHVLFGL